MNWLHPSTALCYGKGTPTESASLLLKMGALDVKRLPCEGLRLPHDCWPQRRPGVDIRPGWREGYPMRLVVQSDIAGSRSISRLCGVESFRSDRDRLEGP
jgi:hypothetical protein